MAIRRWESKKSSQILVQELLDKAQQVDPESICMIAFGVQGLFLITDTANNAILRPDAIRQLKSRHMQEIMDAYYQATVQAEKAALNLSNALSMSLSELDILRTALDEVSMPETSSTLGSWFTRAHVKDLVLLELERVDSSKLVLNPASLLTDFENATAAYEMVVELCKKGRRRRLRKRVTAKAVEVACTVSVIVLSFLRVGLAALAVAAGVLTAGMSAIGAAGINTVADVLLTKLIETLNLKIGAVDAKRKVPSDAQSNAQTLKVDMRTIKIRLEMLQADLRGLSSNVEQARRLGKLSRLLEAQVHAEILKHHESLMQLKALCANLLHSIL